MFDFLETRIDTTFVKQDPYQAASIDVERARAAFNDAESVQECKVLAEGSKSRRY